WRGRVSVPSQQVAVARRKAAPQASLHVIRANALHPILDAPWHHVLVAREEDHAPDRIVCVVPLNVGELQTHVARCGDDDSAPETRCWADRPHANPPLPVFPADGPKPYNGTRSPVTSFRRQRRRTAHD